METICYSNEGELVKLAQVGDEEALEKLINSYRGFIYYICQNYFLKDGDQQDLVQEATIGLLEAIKAYDFNTKVKFRNFAFLCIKRELDSAVTRSNRKKRQILNEAIPIYNHPDDDGNRGGNLFYIGANQLKTEKDTPEESIIEKEELEELILFLQKELTNLEQNVLQLRLQGFSYREITTILEIQTKAVDNAIQRIRRKILNAYTKINNAS
ncbi:MAG TPA: sigma-70 family RNA polymerase sigma factor [Peptococcaceae bacterium]|jgi:RNA polymerase sporulation-specific sigma factor|nr:sigma-70 family RNA polymerase sigma factor [Peptococcaceae bacterium]HPZ71305.1 sigma-70 family RNA polymerase sigma factor [Peptococcaceae bacterium]HQD54778.1 sigma-70 family RNA polymerase sigma factor [Peptococcaceae bacterium]